MTHLRMMDLRINGFWKRAVWFLKEGFEVKSGLFLAAEDAALDNASLSHGARKGHKPYKHMRINLWSASRIVVFERGVVWFFKEGFEVEIFLFLATEDTEGF